MGFMDKAKQMADQAQQKIEETQKQFNESQAQRGSQQPGEGGVRYDANGRPIADSAPPAGATPPAPVASSDQAEVQSRPVPSAPVKDGVNEAPDPFKPIE